MQNQQKGIRKTQTLFQKEKAFTSEVFEFDVGLWTVCIDFSVAWVKGNGLSEKVHSVIIVFIDEGLFGLHFKIRSHGRARNEEKEWKKKAKKKSLEREWKGTLWLTWECVSERDAIIIERECENGKSRLVRRLVFRRLERICKLRINSGLGNYKEKYHEKRATCTMIVDSKSYKFSPLTPYRGEGSCFHTVRVDNLRVDTFHVRSCILQSGYDLLLFFLST